MLNERLRPMLEAEKAQQILNNVFYTNGMERSTIPLETIVSYSNYRKERYTFHRAVIGIMLVLFLLIPLLFLMPCAELVQQTGEPGRPSYQLQVRYGSLVRRITASINNIGMPVFEQENGVYYVKPTRNGEMTVNVSLYNDQFQNLTVMVTGVDEEAPVLLNTQLEENTILLTLQDTGCGINFEAIYAEGEAEKRIKPLAWNVKTGEVLFPYTGKPLTVYVTDYAGNRLQLLLAPQNNGSGTNGFLP